MASSVDAPPDSVSPWLAAPRRRQRAIALCFDIGWLGVALLIAGTVAFVLLLIRTDRGRYDPGDGESLVAAALVASAVPAWLAWVALGALAEAATPGQRALRLMVEVDFGRSAARLLRLAVHPVSLPGWLWLAAAAWIATLYALAALLVAIAGTIAAMAVVSTALVIRDPAARAVHDYVGGTRIRSRATGNGEGVAS